VNDTDDEDVPSFMREGIHSEPILVSDVVTLGLRWISNVLTVTAEGVETTAQAIAYLSNITAAHANYRRNLGRFKREVGQTIERL
jgi:hypothetical protein